MMLLMWMLMLMMVHDSGVCPGVNSMEGRTRMISSSNSSSDRSRTIAIVQSILRCRVVERCCIPVIVATVHFLGVGKLLGVAMHLLGVVGEFLGVDKVGQLDTILFEGSNVALFEGSNVARLLLLLVGLVDLEVLAEIGPTAESTLAALL